MGQEEILQLLQKNLEEFEKDIIKIEQVIKKQDVLFIQSLNKKEIADALGICLQAVTNNLCRLVKKEHVKVLKDELDKRKSKYVINNDLINEIFGDEK